MNKNNKITIIIILLILAFFVVWKVFVFYKTSKIAPLDLIDLRSCKKDSDCVIVEGKSCCSCPSAINKNFINNWNSKTYDKCSKSTLLCSPCLPLNSLKTLCENNVCVSLHK